jgi:hypothetical protein
VTQPIQRHPQNVHGLPPSALCLWSATCQWAQNAAMIMFLNPEPLLCVSTFTIFNPTTMSKIIQFGEEVEGYQVRVLNEREIRAAAGIMFFFAFLSLLIILFKGDFLLAKFVIYLFFVDFVIRVFVNPRFAPTLIIGRMIVGNQRPEYVGAPQKRFSWMIGVGLSGLMFGLMIVYNTWSIFTGLSCLACLIFLFFESVFGICLGCFFYDKFYKEKAKLCPGNVCEPQDRVPIQKVSGSQWLISLGFIVFIALSVFVLKENFKARPESLWKKLGVSTGH